jgi:hypothetical protein
MVVFAKNEVIFTQQLQIIPKSKPGQANITKTPANLGDVAQECMDAQIRLFQHIKSQLPPHVSFVDAIAELLEISIDSAYRRIRGEKPVAFDELQQLCSAYKLSLDPFLMQDSNSFIFPGN